MQAQFPDPLCYVDGYRLVLIPLQDVGENFVLTNRRVKSRIAS